MENVLAVVPARGGSKGVKDKNIYLINGKALLCYAVETGLKCPHVTETYISTDSGLYEEIAKSCGAESVGLRSPELASDSAKTADALIDLVTRLQSLGKNFDYVVLLQPTSPVRRPEDISNMLNILRSRPDASGIVSVSRLIEPHPYKLKKITPEGFLNSFIDGTSSEIPRQQMPPAFKLNGAIYIVRTEFMLQNRKLLDNRTLPYEMEEGVNIDSAADLEYLHYLVSTGKINL
ncbi:acylneuraminate cytidylyltransferase family protein [Adhaeribacter soli]|uniref:Acylneuraminate cytidylyltransferase family protein n=1 Tax=Adhaeribacter soli TaxID=2607655 RepID=A0A5N1ILQ4_9BACT|nr:acylneuraminate cytidylyltransferase family protein [Adhaeribacter soli]KAA9327397.1 acylneuraminate cytidylyltransferase family protein [Adhaeribacter soli]